MSQRADGRPAQPHHARSKARTMQSFSVDIVLARRSQRSRVLMPTVTALSLWGCFAPAPKLSQPEQTPPFVVTSQVTPPLSMVHLLPESGLFDFVVPFRSEDVNEQVVSALYLDLVPGDTNPTFVHLASLSPGTIDEERQFSSQVSLADQITSGCHTLTLTITHESNLDPFVSPLPLVPSRAASVVWFVDVPDPENPTLLGDCPRAGGAEP